MTEVTVPCLWVLYILSLPEETGTITAPRGILPLQGMWPLSSSGITPVPTKSSLPDFLTFLGLRQERKFSNRNKKLSESFSQGSGLLVQGFAPRKNID